jgi:hypothetical protein
MSPSTPVRSLVYRGDGALDGGVPVEKHWGELRAGDQHRESGIASRGSERANAAP